MSRPVFTIIASSALALLATAALDAAESRPPTRAELSQIFQPARVRDVVLSPDGRRVAFVDETAERLLTVIDLDSPLAPEAERPRVSAPNPRQILQSQLQSPGQTSAPAIARRGTAPAVIVNALWSGSSKIVRPVNNDNPPRWLSTHEVTYEQKEAGSRRDHPQQHREFPAALWSLDAVTEADRKLVDGNQLGFFLPPPSSAFVHRPPRIVGWDLSRPGHLLVEGQGTPNSTERVGDIFTVNPATGEFALAGSARDLYVRNDNFLSGRLLYDRTGNIRVHEQRQAELLWKQNLEHKFGGEKFWFSLDSVLGNGRFDFERSPFEFYAPRSFPIAFGRDPDVLYVASNTATDTFSIAAWNLRTGERGDFLAENPARDLADASAAFSERTLVEHAGKVVGIRLPGGATTEWLDPQFARLQTAAEALFPARRVQLLGWNDVFDRLSVLVTGGLDGGRYFVVDLRSTPRITEIARRSPPAPILAGIVTEAFAFDTPGGVHLTGSVTMPLRGLVDRPPLVVFCRSIPDERAESPVPGMPPPPGAQVSSPLERDLQALATFGFAVMQVNYRGSAGQGRAHLAAAAEAFDRVPLADLRAAIAWTRAHYPIDPRRAALVGEGFGGYLALRAAELFPAEFSCIVGINAPANLAHWVEGTTVTTVPRAVRQAFFAQSRIDLSDLSALREADRIARPVLILQDSNNPLFPAELGRELRDRLARVGSRDVEYAALGTPFARQLGVTRAQTFLRIGEFLNEHIYDFQVETGPLREVR